MIETETSNYNSSHDCDSKECEQYTGIDAASQTQNETGKEAPINIDLKSEKEVEGFGEKTSNTVDALVGNIVAALILSVLCWLSYKFIWDREQQDEQKQIMYRGIVVVLGLGASYKWFKALFSS